MFQLNFPQGSNKALVTNDWVLSFDELHHLREILGGEFLKLLTKKQTRVLGCLNDDISALLALLTITELCDFMPINPELTSTEVRKALQHSKNVDIAIISSNFMDTHSASLRKAVPLILDWDSFVRKAKEKLDTSEITISQNSDVQPLGSEPGRLILHTSGSTGDPKRVPINLSSIHQSAENICSSLQLSNNDIALNILPTFHIGALVDVLLAPFYAGGAVSISDTRHPNELADTLISIRPTWLQLVPTILLRLVEDLSPERLKDAGMSLSFIRCISAPLSPNLKAKAESLLGCPVIEMYGMTETAGQIATNTRDDPHKLGSVGKTRDVPVILLDSFGNKVENGKLGEICVSGPTVFNGYEGVDQSTVFFDEWFRTGDLGEFDPEGYLFLRGRIKEMINVGGEKASPLEIENTATLHPKVLEAAAYALPHPSLGEQVGLTITCTEETNLEDIRNFLKRHLADFKLPRKIIRTHALPRLPNAKVDRVLIKREGEKALTKRITNKSSKSKNQQALNANEKLISDLWVKELNCREPSGDDDFFDMGGDSLSATSFLVAIEKSLGRRVSPNQLFETPTYDLLVQRLNISQESNEESKPPSIAFIEKRMSGWLAKPHLHEGLFRGVSTLRSRQIIFWCTQSFGEFQDITTTLGSVHPMYITCSLYKYPNRTEQDFHDLANVLVSEIQIIQPHGQIVLGGYCGGGVVMHHVAEQLEAAGRKVKLFLSLDYWMKRPTNFPVLHVISTSKEYSNYELGLHALHPNGSEIIKVSANHINMTKGNFLTPHLPLIYKTITDGISLDQAYKNAISPLWSLAERRKTPLGEISINTRNRVFIPGRTSQLKLTLKNNSRDTWLKTTESGLSVVVKLLNLDMHYRERNAGYSEIPKLNPGEEISLTIDIQFPKLKLPFIVEVLLSNQGIQDFHDKESGRLTYLVLPNFLTKIH